MPGPGNNPAINNQVPVTGRMLRENGEYVNISEAFVELELVTT